MRKIFFLRIDSKRIDGGLKWTLLKLFLLASMHLVFNSTVKEFFSIQKTVFNLTLTASPAKSLLCHNFWALQNLWFMVFFLFFLQPLTFSIVARNSSENHLFKYLPDLCLFHPFQLPFSFVVKCSQIQRDKRFNYIELIFGRRKFNFLKLRVNSPICLCDGHEEHEQISSTSDSLTSWKG